MFYPHSNCITIVSMIQWGHVEMRQRPATNGSVGLTSERRTAVNRWFYGVKGLVKL
jgi:hypothetical protein